MTSKRSTKLNGLHVVSEQTKKKTTSQVVKQIASLDRLQKTSTHAVTQALDGIIILDSTQTVTFFNKAAEVLFGHPSNQVVGQKLDSIVNIQLPELDHSDLMSGSKFELQLTKKSGELFWCSLSLSQCIVDGEVHFTIFCRDVTEHKNEIADLLRKQQELTEQLQEYDGGTNNYIMEAVNRSNAMIEFSMDGAILAINDNFLSILGYAAEELIGQHHHLLLKNDSETTEKYKHVWAKLNRGEFVTGTVTLVNKAGEEVHIQATYNPILAIIGIPSKVIVYATDITEFTKALKAVSEFTSQLSDGNFEVDLQVTAEGDLAKMVQDNLKLRDTLKEILIDVNKVVRAAGEEGNLHARLNTAHAKGAWRYLGDSINQLLQSIAEPVMEFNKLIINMAEGDLTQSFQMSASGEIKNMGEALNKTISNFNRMLYNIGSNADVVASSSMNMLEKTEGMKRNTNEVASAISQMAKGAQDQASRTDESSKLVEKMMVSSEEMEKKASIINKAAERGQKSSENGLKIMKTLVNNMSGIKESAGQTSKSIEILTQRAEEIGRTLNVITDIASQTNLLALNAAIEAARAGDAGRGFAVVAEEIRKLAEGSRKSAVEIEKIISDVQKDTNAASKAIDTMQVSVKDGSGATLEAESIFKEIANSSDETFSYSKDIHESTLDQKLSIDLVVKNIEQIVVVAEETAAGTQQVASSSQQLSNSMAEITDGSNKLSGIATELQACINMFKLRKVGNA